MLKDEHLRAEYEKAANGKKRLFSFIMADFLNAPEIEEINMSDYHGERGDEIEILVTDELSVEKVIVSIFKPDGSLIEEGEATKKGEYLFTYTCQESNQEENFKIEVQAMDKPGNITKKEA